MNVLAQMIGIVAMVLSALSFQMKTRKQIIVMQIATSIVFGIHYFMIGALTACVVNLVAIVRNLAFYYKNNKVRIGMFCVIMPLCAILSWQGPISLLMCVGMLFNTLAVAADKPVSTRKRILVSSPFVLIYNIFVMSIGGIINEILVDILTVITLVRECKKANKCEKS